MLVATLLLLFAALFLPSESHAETEFCYWEGHSLLGPEWSRVANWYVLRRPDSDDDAYFEATSGAHGVVVDEPWTIRNLVIFAEETYLFSGARLTFLNGAIDQRYGSANHGFICPVRFEGTNGVITNVGPGQLTLTGNVSLAVSQNMTVSNSNLPSTIQIRGNITGSAGALHKNGDALLKLAGTNTYVADTFLNDGTTLAENAEVIGTGTLHIGGGALLDLDGYNETVGPGAVNEIGIRFRPSGGTIDLGGTDNVLTISALGTWIQEDCGTTSSISGGKLDLATSAGTREVEIQCNSLLTISSRIIGGGNPGPNPSLRKTGSGRLVLSGANEFRRALRIDNGTVRIRDAAGLGLSGDGNETILGGGDLIVDLIPPGGAIDESLVFTGSDRVYAVGDCELAGPIAIESVSPAFEIADGAACTISGIVDGTAAPSARKTGAGTLRLTGANTYEGGTAVEAGMLVADAATGSATGGGPVTVWAGAVLAARGSLDGAITLETDATLRIGDEASTATLAVPEFAAQDGAAVWMKLGGTREIGASDRLDVAGNAVLSGTLQITALTEPALGDSFALLTYAGRTGQFPVVDYPALADSSLGWAIEYGPTVLSVRVVEALLSSAPDAAADGPPRYSRAGIRAAVPNPTSGATELRFALAQAGRVELIIYDVHGRKVAGLLSGAQRSAGEHHVAWDGRDDLGHPAASGAYLVRLRVGGTPVGRSQRIVVWR